MDAYAQIAARIELRGGDLYWLPVEETNCTAKTWNRKHAGKKISRIDTYGYLTVHIKYRPYKAHRVVWLLVNGEWPKGEIDHINGDKLDNRIENLRVVDRSMNSRNMARRSDNTSGMAGVVFNARKNRWQAAICVAGRRQHLGTFTTFDAAATARATAASLNGFTARHGQ